MRKPRLFYWEDECTAWIPVPENYTVKDLICNITDMLDGEFVELCFKRIDLTDDELEALPEA